MKTSDILSMEAHELRSLYSNPKKLKEALAAMRKTAVSRLRAEDERFRKAAGMPTVAQENYETTGSITTRSQVDYTKLNVYSPAALKLQKAGGIKRERELTSDGEPDTEKMKKQFDTLKTFLNSDTSTARGFNRWKENMSNSIVDKLSDQHTNFTGTADMFKAMNPVQWLALAEIRNYFEKMGVEVVYIYGYGYVEASTQINSDETELDEGKYNALDEYHRSMISDIDNPMVKAVMTNLIYAYEEDQRKRVLGIENKTYSEDELSEPL